jgi:hypothetical protein
VGAQRNLASERPRGGVENCSPDHTRKCPSNYVRPEFLKRLLAGVKRPIYLIVDRGPAHISKKTRDFVKTLGDNFKLFYLPPYASRLQKQSGFFHAKPSAKPQKKSAPSTKSLHSNTPHNMALLID